MSKRDSATGNDGRGPYTELEKEVDKTGRSIKRTKTRVNRQVKKTVHAKIIKECEDISAKTERILP